MNIHPHENQNLITPIFRKQLWFIVFSSLSVLIGSGIVYLRGNNPGIVLENIMMVSDEGEREQEIPFTLSAEQRNSNHVVFNIYLNDIPALSSFHSPSIAIVRPLYYIELSRNNVLLTPSIEQKIGRDVLIMPIDPSWESITIKLQGDFESGGIADNIIVGNSDQLVQYFRMRSMTSIFLMTILLSSAVSMFLLFLFRPLEELFLSVGSFALSLALNIFINADVWFLFSHSIEWQLRLKGFSIALNIALSLYLLITFTKYTHPFFKKLVSGLILVGTGSLWIPSMEAVLLFRSVLNILCIPFIICTAILLVANLYTNNRELRYFYRVSSLLLIGGVIDLMAVYGLHLFPPIMPINSALFILGITLFFVIEYNNYSERYQTIVQKSLDGIVIIDKNGLVIDINPVATQLNLANETFLFEIFEKNEVSTDLLLTQPYDFTFHLDDTDMFLECYTTPLEQDRVLLVFRNMTQQKIEAQRKLKQVRLETIEKVSGGIAHDFNNLFMALQGQMMMLSETGTKENARSIENMQVLLDNGSQSIQRLQSFIRGETPSQEKIILQEWLQKIEPLCQSILRETTIHWALPATPILVNINQKEFEQILVNILFNAYDAMQASRTQPELWIEVIRHEDTARIEIEDSGTGIPQAKRKEIFKPFVSSKGSDQGKGLGLSIVQDSIQRLGGHIHVTSPHHGMGARFVIDLPCQISPAVETKSPTTPYQILVIEDEQLIRETLERFLIKGGYKALLAATVEEAKEIIRTETVHCIISDVILGLRSEDNGIDLCNQFVEQGYVNPIIISSGYIPEQSAQLGDSWRFLSKPFVQSDLLHLLDTTLQENMIFDSGLHNQSA